MSASARSGRVRGRPIVRWTRRCASAATSSARHRPARGCAGWPAGGPVRRPPRESSCSARRASGRGRDRPVRPGSGADSCHSTSPPVCSTSTVRSSRGTALGRSRMLVRPHDRGVGRHVPIHPTGRVGLGLNHAQQLVRRAIGREAMMPLPHRLPRSEPLRKITPSHPVGYRNDALDHLTMITPRTTTTHRPRHQRLDPSPRSLAEFS